MNPSHISSASSCIPNCNPDPSSRCNLVANVRSTSMRAPTDLKPSSSILIGQQLMAHRLDYTPIFHIPWYISAFPNIRQAKIFLEAIITDTPLDIQLFNHTTDSVAGSMRIYSTGFHEFSFRVPNSNCRLVLNIRKVAEGSHPLIFGIGLQTPARGSYFTT